MSSASVDKTNLLFVKGKCFNDCEVTLTVGKEKTQFYVCIDHLAKLSDYFRIMFYGDFKEKNKKQFQIEDETTKDMICFFNAIDPNPYVRKITDDSIGLLMRLTDKFQCDLLRDCLKHYIEVNGPNCKSATTTLYWLIWSKQYHMPEEIVNVCMNVLKIADYSIGLLMRSIEEYQCDVLKERLKNYIEVNGPNCKSATTTADWLIWSQHYNMPEDVVKVCVDVLKIGDDSIRLLMHLIEKYQRDVLKEPLKNYVEVNGPNCKSATTTLNWLIWSKEYDMPEDVVKVCVDVQKIGANSVQWFMCWADENQCDVMKDRMMQYIEVNEPNCKSASTILKWLISSLEFHMPQDVIKACLPGVACLSLSTLRANGEKIGWELLAKLLDVKMKLNCKAIAVKENVTLGSFTCMRCGVKDHLPYGIRWCATNSSHTDIRCSACFPHSFFALCCAERSGIYYKCSLCQLDPSSFETKDQCLCARENYKMLLG